MNAKTATIVQIDEIAAANGWVRTDEWTPPPPPPRIPHLAAWRGQAVRLDRRRLQQGPPRGRLGHPLQQGAGARRRSPGQDHRDPERLTGNELPYHCVIPSTPPPLTQGAPK
ncbi:hypothetical protein SEA_EMMAELYSIA_35 [Mycobacterium phage EmmaElysia]|nr:hypothetical protein SEA_EMMAELYSIA_35 [Mycobacterium phage EmmaElysia]